MGEATAQHPHSRPVTDGAPLAALIALHREQRNLCDCLETIADSLPAALDRRTCLVAARTLVPVLGRAQIIRTTILFPALKTHWLRIIDFERTIERLEFEQLEDQCFAEEVAEALLAWGCGEPRPPADALGYMLRGFFDGVRRHIAFEEELLVPLFRLTSVARYED